MPEMKGASANKLKRKAAYRRQAAAAKRCRFGGGGQLASAGNCRGLLITCNKRERECVGEAYDLLDAFLSAAAAEEDEPVEASSAGAEDADEADKEEAEGADEVDEEAEDDDDDIQSRIEREKLAAAGGRGRGPQAQGKSSPVAFDQLRTQVSNCVFVRVSRPAVDSLPWLFSVTDAVFEAALTGTGGGPQSGGRRGVGGRHILRLLPVEGTCASGLDEIAGAFSPLWDAFAASGEVRAERPTFTVHFKARNFDKLDRQDVIGRIYAAVKAATPDWSVNHDLADVVIDVNVLQKVTCISLLRRFRRYRKYNLSEVALQAVLGPPSADANDLKSRAKETAEAVEVKTERAEAVEVKTERAEAVEEKTERAEAVEEKTERTEAASDSPVMVVPPTCPEAQT